MEVSVGVDMEMFVLYIATTTNHLQTSSYFTADFYYLFYHFYVNSKTYWHVLTAPSRQAKVPLLVKKT